MKRLLCLVAVVSLLAMLIPNALGASINDDQCVTEVLLKYADSLGKVSYKEMKEYLDSLGYTYETKIGSNELATFNVDCDLGGLYICFFPLGNDDSYFGNPEKEMLSCLEYSREEKWITISDNMHSNGGKLKTGDKSRDPVNQEVSSLEKLIDFYNGTIGGSVSLDAGATVSTDSSRENKVKSTIETRIKKYSDTTLQSVDVNSNIGTDDPDDFLVLIHFSWGTMNGVSRTQIMLEMFSDDMAATLADAYDHVSDITIFWEVPYLLKKGTCAKYSYTVRKGGAYLKEKTGPLYK